jgi:phosphoribosylanthranilate isomerase
MLLKVCGLRSAQQAAVVAALGADAIGVIAVPQSPRWLAPEHRLALFEAVRAARPGCLGVLVVADPAEAELPQLGPAAGHQVLQLHGGETPQRCAELRERLGPELILWKALRIRRQADLELAEAYATVVDALLLDAWVPDQLGGTGHRIPIEWLEGFRPALPWWLAGGITPERLPGALQALKTALPAGVDASSGVERAPGDKDLDRVAQLVAAVAPFRQDRPI